MHSEYITGWLEYTAERITFWIRRLIISLGDNNIVAYCLKDKANISKFEIVIQSPLP